MKLLKTSAAVNGFTLIELLIVMGVLALLAAVGVPIGLDFYLDYQLDSETSLLVSVLQQARNLAMINRNESNHGVYLASEDFIIFQGATFAGRVVAQDRFFPRAYSISVTSPTELVFAALSGQTASSTYSLSDGRKTRNVYVNEEGLIY